MRGVASDTFNMCTIIVQVYKVEKIKYRHTDRLLANKIKEHPKERESESERSKKTTEKCSTSSSLARIDCVQTK